MDQRPVTQGNPRSTGSSPPSPAFSSAQSSQSPSAWGQRVAASLGLAESDPFDSEDLALMARDFCLVQLRRGSTADQAGRSALVHVVLTGMVELRQLTRSRQSIVLVLGPGSTIGANEIFVPGTNKFQAVAATEVEMASIVPSDLGELLRTRSGIANLWMAALSRSRVEHQRRIADLLVGHLDHRVSATLLNLADSNGRVELTQKQLAQLVGVQRSSVNEAARRLEVRGLIQRCYGHIMVIQPLALRELING